MEYLTLLRSHGRLLAFGFVVAFTSSAGQTYFIGVFGPQIQASFGLSHTEWGSYYLIGTLLSAAVLPWSGGLLDKVELKRYCAAVLLGLSLSAYCFGQAGSVFGLIFGIFLLRQTGQGLASHTAITTISRYLGSNRGKGIAVASMGFSIGEAILPFLAVLLIAAMGWRQTYLIVALGVLCLLLLSIWLLWGVSFETDVEETHVAQAHIAKKRPGVSNELPLLGASSESTGLSKSCTRKHMFSQGHFYCLLPAIIVPSLIMTGLFFHHLTIAEMKHWSPAWVTGQYWVYALSSILTLFFAGPLIDRFTAVRVVPAYLLPLCLALMLLIPAQDPRWVVLYMLLLGVTSGLHFSCLSALWAELYGTAYLGGIKSAVGSIGVFGSALGPVIIGVLLDMGASLAQISLTFVGMCLFTTTMLIVGLKGWASWRASELV